MNDYLSYYTTGTRDTTGKLKILVCYHPDEENLFKSARAELMNYCDQAVLFYPANQTLYSGDTDYMDHILGFMPEMHGLFICVTSKLLSDDGNAAKKMMDAARAGSIPILPYFCEPDLFDSWNQYLEIQAINPFDSDSTQISYHTKVANWIEQITPLSEDVVNQIWQQFEHRIFLSYRKMDRKYVDRLMRNIHGDVRNNPYAWSGIWYDEALTSEDNFNQIIMDQIANSDLFLMLITPNTFAPNSKGEKNYVLEKEYPAMEQGNIIGILAEDVDEDLARSTFPNILIYVKLDDLASLSRALHLYLSSYVDIDSKTARDFYLMGLAYLKGIGTEISISNSVPLFLTALNKELLPEAVHALVSLSFDPAEKAKGDDGFYDPDYGIELQVKLISSMIEKQTPANDYHGIQNIFNEMITLLRYLIACDQEALYVKAYQLFQTFLGWIRLLQKDLPNDSFLESLAGELDIEMGHLQYKRHVFRDHNERRLEDGAIAYLKTGIPQMKLRFENRPSIKMADLYTLTGAYDMLADSYYKQGTFSKQRLALLEKFAFVEKYADNEMDRAQLLELSDSYYLLAEACMMCDQTHLDEAISFFETSMKYLLEASEIMEDLQTVQRSIKLQNAFGKAICCKMDLEQDHTTADLLLSAAMCHHEEAVQLAKDYLQAHPNDSTLFVQYLLGVTYLDYYRLSKINNAMNYELLDEAYDMICSYVDINQDYDVLHSYYRVQLEMMYSKMYHIFANSTTPQINTLQNVLSTIDSLINEIEEDSKKHNDYWLSLDRVELYSAKAEFLLKIYKAGIQSPDILNDIDRALYAATSYGTNIYTKDVSENSAVLLGALWKAWILNRDLYMIIGDQNEVFRSIQIAGQYIERRKKDCLNDYMK